MQSPPAAETWIDGRRAPLYFGGCGYLGLAARPEVIEAACAATRRYGIHSATSRSGFGNNPPTLAVERLAAEFFGTEDAFYFASGYVGNHILVQALAPRCDAVAADASAHFCLDEAARLLGVPVVRFGHCDAEDLRRQLRSTTPRLTAAAGHERRRLLALRQRGPHRSVPRGAAALRDGHDPRRRCARRGHLGPPGAGNARAFRTVGARHQCGRRGPRHGDLH